MPNTDPRPFLKKCLLFPVPLIVLLVLYYLVELFLLPVDFYTFRVWEALYVKKYTGLLPGFFYPNRKLRKIEEGDIAHGTPWAVRRPAEWETDEFGYRNRDPHPAPYDILVTGDSFAAGCSVSQEETLSEVLARRLGRKVYSFAPVFDPCPLDRFFREKRFETDPPKVVLLVLLERNITSLGPPVPPAPEKKGEGTRLLEKLDRFPWFRETLVLGDRLDKAMLWNDWSARRQGPDMKRILGNTTDPGRILFYFGDEANRPVSREQVEKCARTLRLYRDLLEARHIHFLFCPVPNKESVYFDYLPSGKGNDFLERLQKELERRKVETLDVKKAFRGRYRKDRSFLYRKDDGHWNPQGIGITAGLIAKVLKAKAW